MPSTIVYRKDRRPKSSQCQLLLGSKHARNQVSSSRDRRRDRPTTRRSRKNETTDPEPKEFSRNVSILEPMDQTLARVAILVMGGQSDSLDEIRATSSFLMSGAALCATRSPGLSQYEAVRKLSRTQIECL